MEAQAQTPSRERTQVLANITSEAGCIKQCKVPLLLYTCTTTVMRPMPFQFSFAASPF